MNNFNIEEYFKIENFTNSNLQKLNELSTLKKKIDFFSEVLECNYIIFLEHYNETHNIFSKHINSALFKKKKDPIVMPTSFEIKPTKKEFSEFNEWILKNHSLLSKITPARKLIKSAQLKKEFNKELLLSNYNIDKVIEEIKKIKSSFHQINKTSTSFLNSAIPNYSNWEYNADYDSYENYIEYRKEPEYSTFFYGLQVLQIFNGKELAEYHIFLQDKLKQIQSGKFKQRNDDLTIKEKVLLLYSFGLLGDNSIDTSDIARILSRLLNVNQKDFYDCCREVNLPANLKNQKSIASILDFLEENEIKHIPKSLILK